MKKRDWGRKTTQVVWEDLRPWVEQLRETHALRVLVEVHLLAERYGVKPTVVVETYHTVGEKAQKLHRRLWQGFDASVCGSAASAACHLVSRMLLDCDEDKARAERDDLLL